MTAGHQPPIDIAWTTDSELAWLSTEPDLCKKLFGQRALLLELITLIQNHPQQSHWYRPARLLVDTNWAAAGGFKGPPHKTVVEIGYRVHPDFRRQGCASALVRWLCHTATDRRMRQVVAVTLSNNRASQGVLSHNGFVHTGDLLSDSQHWLQRWQYTVPR